MASQGSVSLVRKQFWPILITSLPGRPSTILPTCRVENLELLFVRLLHSISDGVKFIINQERINYFSSVVENPRVGFFQQEKKKLLTSTYTNKFWKIFFRRRRVKEIFLKVWIWGFRTCFHLYCYINNISADVSSGLLKVFLVKLGSLLRTLNHTLYLFFAGWALVLILLTITGYKC